MTLNDLAGPRANTVAQQIARSLEVLQLTDEEVALQAELPHPSMIKHFKAGTMRLPLNRVLQVAKAIDVEPGHLMRLALNEIHPELAEQMEQCMGPLTLSPGEARLINVLREQAKGRDISPVMFSGDSVVALLVA